MIMIRIMFELMKDRFKENEQVYSIENKNIQLFSR